MQKKAVLLRRLLDFGEGGFMGLSPLTIILSALFFKTLVFYLIIFWEKEKSLLLLTLNALQNLIY